MRRSCASAGLRCYLHLQAVSDTADTTWQWHIAPVSAVPGPTAATAGRSLDRIGFRVRDLETLCRHIASMGTAFTRAYATDRNGMATALLAESETHAEALLALMLLWRTLPFRVSRNCEGILGMQAEMSCRHPIQ